MAEQSIEKKLKLAGLKGMDTSNPDGEPETNPILESSKDKITSSDAYITPKSKDQNFATNLASSGINGVTSDVIKGTNFMVDPIAKNLFTPVDLSIAIPDPNERAKYIEEHGSKMTQLLNPNTYGITFNREIADYAGFRKQNYPKQLKKFVDDLDENQGWVSSLGNNFAKLLGSTTAKIGAGLIAPIYGVGSALYNLDGSKIRNNSAMDFFQEMDEDINKEFVVYGGYDYGKKLDDAGNVVGQQTFFSRLFSHPFKSINDDIVPTVSFVAGAVGSEVILGRLGIHAGASKLARGFFRAGAFGAQKFAKGYRVIRGLDKLSDIESMRRVIKVSNAMTKGAGTIGTMYRSAAYESALIGNDTEDNTLMQSKFGYIQSNSALLSEYQQLISENTDEFGNLLITQEEIIDKVSEKIPPGMLAEMRYSAKMAGKAAYLTNIPLVGASYMIQFPKIFGTSYRGGQKILSKTGPLYGATMEGGKLVSNFSKAKGFEKLVFKYALPSLKSGGTEAFEEFSQGVIEKGYADYWSAPYSDTSVDSSIGFLQAMGSASRKYIKSVEGIDSVTLGFLMGAIGIPMVKTKASGKIGLGWSGGAYEAVSEVNEKISEVEAAIKAYNDGPQTNEVLKNNFDAFRANVTIQEQKEKALEEGDVYNYKNAEHDELHNYVENKMQNGILDTVYQDIEALKEMSLEQFNEQFAHKEGDYQFTEESKKKNLETFEENINQTVKAFDTTETVFNDKRAWIDRFFAKDYTGLNEIKEFATQDIKNAVKDQPETEAAVRNYIRGKQNVFKKKVFSLLSTTNNLQKREKELQDRLRELAPNVNLNALSKDENYKEVLAALEKGDKIYFAEEEGKKKLNSFISEILSNIKEENFENYNLNKDEIRNLVNDIFKIKSRKAKISEIYSTLFTKKGANKWLTLQAELENRFQEELLDDVRKQAEEAVEKKQDAASLKTVLDNYRQIFKEELPANSEKITEQLQNLSKKLDEEEGISYDTLVKLLKDGKNTNLIEHIFEVLNNRDQMPSGLKFSLDNIDQFNNDQEFKNNFLQAFTTIYNNFENIIEEISTALTNPGNKKVQNTTPEPSNEGFEEDDKQATTLDSMLDEIIEEETKGIIPTINEKKLIFDEDKNIIVKINPNTGKPFIWEDSKGNPSNQPDIKGYNMKLVNSPNWLNNEYLEKNNVTATFKFSEDKYGDKANNDASNIGINVFHGDVFIGRLPVATSDPSSIALREALYNGKVDKDGTILGKESTAVTQEYSGYKSTVTEAKAKETILDIASDLELLKTLKKGDNIIHPEFGRGEILNIIVDPGGVRFDQVEIFFPSAKDSINTNKGIVRISKTEERFQDSKLIKVTVAPKTETKETSETIIQSIEPTIQTKDNITFGTAGQVGENKNEDAVYVDTENGLYILADGMGGMNRVASQSAGQASSDIVNMLKGTPVKTGTELLYEEFQKNPEMTAEEAMDFLGMDKNASTAWVRIINLNYLLAGFKGADFTKTSDNKGYKSVTTGAVTAVAKKVAPNKYEIEKVGDTVFFVVDKNGKVIQSHGLSTNASVDEAYMFSVKDGKPMMNSPKVDRFTVELKDGQTLVLATDFIETEKAMDDFIKTDFGKNIDFEKFQDENKNDDSTFIVIKEEGIVQEQTTTPEVQLATVEEYEDFEPGEEEIESGKMVTKYIVVDPMNPPGEGESYNPMPKEEATRQVEELNKDRKETTSPETEMSEAEEIYVGIQDIMMELEPGTKEWDDAIDEMAELEKIIVKEREEKGLPSPRPTEQKGVKVRKQSTQEEINESKETVKKLLEDIDQAAEAGQRPNRDLIGAIFTAKLTQVRNYNTSVLEKMIANKKEKIKAAKAAKNANINASGKTKQINANLISLIPVLNKELKALESLLAEGVTPSEAALKQTTSPETEIEARKKKLGINKNILKIDSAGTTASLSTKVRIQTPDGGILIIKPGKDGDLNFERVVPKGMYVKRNDLDPYDEVTLQDNFDEINKKENLIPQKLVDILIKEASFKGKKQTLKNPQYTDIQKKIFAVSEKANSTSVPDQGPTKEYKEEILDPLSEFTDLFLKEIYEGEIERHKKDIAYNKKKGDEVGKKLIKTLEEYIAVYENEIAALEQTNNVEVVTYKGTKYSVDFNVGSGTITNLKTGKVLKGGVTSPVGQAVIDKAIAQQDSAEQTNEVETEVEQTAREKVIDKNFEDIIKQLTANPTMQGDAFIGKEKC